MLPRLGAGPPKSDYEMRSFISSRAIKLLPLDRQCLSWPPMHPPSTRSRNHKTLPSSPPRNASGFGSRGRQGARWAGGRVPRPYFSFPVNLQISPVFVTTRLTLIDAGLNTWLIFIPIAWLSHFKGWGHGMTFSCMSWRCSFSPGRLFIYSFSLLPCYRATRKALRLGRRTTSNVLREGPRRLNCGHSEQVSACFPSLTNSSALTSGS